MQKKRNQVQAKIIVSILAMLLVFTGFANEPDSAYVFAYTTNKNHNTNGLHYAWSIDGKQFNAIGPEFRFLFSDFGTWGSQKKLIDPFMLRDEDGTWHCLWTLNWETGQLAHAATTDLIHWKPQSYPEAMHEGNVKQIEVFKQGDHYTITWLSDVNGEEKVFKTTSADFKTYTPTEEASPTIRKNLRQTVRINAEDQKGVIMKVAWKNISALIDYYQLEQYLGQLNAETTRQDPERFRNLEPVKASFTIDPSKGKAISTNLIGVFFEDINYAADGGIYAELVQNRGFEYNIGDTFGRDKNWNAKKSWSLTGDGITFEIDSVQPIHINQKHYAVLSVEKAGSGLANKGYDGIVIRKGDKYDFSIWAKSLSEGKKDLMVVLQNKDGKILGGTTINKISGEWKKFEAVITAESDDDQAKLVVIPETIGKIAVDLISLFPQKTFKERKNGLRADLAQTIADIHPKFIRFPGGCVAHGNGLDNIYRWKNTVGPIETRKTQPNIWNYHQSAGLGYFEFFQYCEDIGAQPLPVVAAGVPCQNSSCGGYGQQGGIPMDDMGDYVQEILDLIEWANGDKNSKWGKVRAQAGHPEPFKLKYLGVGNEDLITDIFEERFAMIYDAIKEKYPEITVIGTVGPFYRGSDYVEGWNFATQLGVPMVDEHYYQPPGWFINNQDYYDKYDRSKPKVYLGEYASHLPRRPMNIETALSEALYLTAVERNGDVVEMTSFAPLLAKEHHTQWNPDLIYFNNTEVKPTVDYYVQKLYGQNSGDTYLPAETVLSNHRNDVQKRVAISTVKDTENNCLIVKLVNMLPTEVNASIDLGILLDGEKEANLTTLQGDPTDRNAKPVESKITVNRSFEYTLAKYSFSVIRINLDE